MRGRIDIRIVGEPGLASRLVVCRERRFLPLLMQRMRDRTAHTYPGHIPVLLGSLALANEPTIYVRPVALALSVCEGCLSQHGDLGGGLNLWDPEVLRARDQRPRGTDELGVLRREKKNGDRKGRDAVAAPLGDRDPQPER